MILLGSKNPSFIIMFLGSKDPLLLFGFSPEFLELSNDPWYKGSPFIVWPSSLVLGTERCSLVQRILFYYLAFMLSSWN